MRPFAIHFSEVPDSKINQEAGSMSGPHIKRTITREMVLVKNARISFMA